MGSQTKYNKKRLVFVNLKAEVPGAGPVAGAPAFAYGFPTNIKAGDGTELGHQAVDIAAPPAKFVIGTSFPKPARASVRKGLYFVSSFADISAYATLKTAGWSVTRSRSLPPVITGDRPFVTTIYVEVRGIKYAWQRPKTILTNTNAADLGTLGHNEPTIAEYDELVFGAEFPRPARASIIVAAAGSGPTKRISTFANPT